MPLPLAVTKLLVRTGAARFVPAAKRLTGGATDYLRYYSDAVLTAPVDDLLDPAAFPRPAGPDVLNLNEPAPRSDSPVSAGWAADRTGPPPAWGLPELRDAVADTFRRRGNKGIDPGENVLVTHGASGAFAAALGAFVNPGDRVVLFAPSSPLFAVGAKARRAAVRWVPTTTEAGRLKFDPAVLTAAARGAKLLVVSDPGNPSGGTLAAEDQERIAWLAARYDVLIYLDESFAKLRFEGKPNGLAVMPGADRRTLSAGSLTPGFGLGSVRVGWLAGPKPLVQACALTATLSAPFVPTVCQRVAARSLAAGDDLFAPVLDQFRGRVRFAADKLKAMGLDPAWPGGGYFLWVPVAGLGLTGRAFAERLLAEQRVLVGPGDVYGPGGDGFVRVSVAADDGRVREGLARLEAFVAGLRGEPVVRAASVPAPAGEPIPAEPEAPAAAEPERRPSFSRV
jgi:aspartate/methionine/tyrosine aminotransferase